MMRVDRSAGPSLAALLTLALFALGPRAAAQDSLFEQGAAEREDAPMTEEQKAAGARESIF